MSIENVSILVHDDNHPLDTPVPGVVVRVFEATGTHFIMSAMTDEDGIAHFSLVAPATYQVRFFKERVSIQQPARIDTVEAPVAPLSNDFRIEGHVFKPPEAVHPRMCRASGFFRRPDNSPAVGHDVHFIAKFDPLLFEGMAMLTERVHQRTDERGYMQVDLVRCGQYEVTVEGLEDCLRVITIPEAPSVNLPDLLFPVVDRVVFDPEGPWSIGIGAENDFTITPEVWTSDGRKLPGSALSDVQWRSSNPNVFAVLPTSTTLVLRGMGPGTAELQALRVDNSIIRIPYTTIQGVPVTVNV